MKLFHISDVLSVTAGPLVSTRHMEGVYDILNFLTGDQLFTHQLPRAANECKPWLAAHFPLLMEDDPQMQLDLERLNRELASVPRTREDRGRVCSAWVESIRVRCGMPEMLPVHEMGAEMHTHINPIQELEAMVGRDRVITVSTEEKD